MLVVVGPVRASWRPLGRVVACDGAGFSAHAADPPKRAVATSLVAVAIFSIPALVTHALLGHINWAFAIPLTIGVVPGAQIGSRITVGASEKTVRTMAGIFFVVLAVVYGTSEVLAF